MTLCVTGPMAAGKNAAQDILAQRGFVTVDADILVHETVEEQKEAILREFAEEAEDDGVSLISADGTLDRRALGSIVFRSARNVARQEAIVYPALNERFNDFLSRNEGRDIAVNATVLFKVPLMDKMDSVLYIDAPFFLRLSRIRRRDGLPLKQILERMWSQRHLFAKYRLCNADTRRVWNIGTRHRLEKKIDVYLASRR